MRPLLPYVSLYILKPEVDTMKIKKDEVTKLAEILGNFSHSMDLSDALYTLLKDRKTKLHLENYDLDIEIL
jgi:hypothetical protein